MQSLIMDSLIVVMGILDNSKRRGIRCERNLWSTLKDRYV